MIKSKLMTQVGLAALSSIRDEHENMQALLWTNNWEDALAYLVSNHPTDKLMTWILAQLMADTVALSQQEKCCAQDILKWLEKRDDDCRWRIFNQAGELGFDSTVGALGLALFWSQGSMTPAEFEAVYPENHLAPVMLHCVLMLMSIQLAGEQAPLTGARVLVAHWYASIGRH
ncbi:DUF6931 family protein [Serratia liquefaciens]|uniref:DUF6931 family protein n=1 Tax=Serratia liquefaciens TaxID=614 RepID=UPI00165CEF13|nr:hypothetical protein [Serratia liquefaciens]QNQ55456.1 hypothetical protein IAI46_05565 [Serratia liquefaciens]